MNCADCGEDIELSVHTGRWGVRNGRTRTMTCRLERDDNGRLLSADYHYVPGEEQRHFRAELGTSWAPSATNDA